MNVTIPSPAVEFNFDSTCPSPYVSAPLSPHSFGNYFFSAPTSPTGDPLLVVNPFNWEQNPDNFNSTDAGESTESDPDFAFDFSGQLKTPSPFVFAEELFHAGKIRPLDVYGGQTRINNSPKSPKRVFKEALSPRKKTKEIKQTHTDKTGRPVNDKPGRETTYNPAHISFIRQENYEQTSNRSSSSSASSSSTSFSTWYKKWSLKDLFRSPHTSKDPLKINASLKKHQNENVKSSSYRYSGSANSVPSRGKRQVPVSAHELHYKVNRAASEEMRRKSFLPYRHVLLGSWF